MANLLAQKHRLQWAIEPDGMTVRPVRPPGLQPVRPSHPPVAALVAAKKKSTEPFADLAKVGAVSPSLGAILRPQAAYRWLLPYLASITPTYIESVLRGALAGNHVQAWELFDLMIDTDPEIAACVSEWTNGILAKRLVVEPYHDEDEQPSPLAVEKQKVVSAALQNMRPDAANDENSIRGTIKDILAARFHGQSVLEIDWQDTYGTGELNIRQVPKLGKVLCPRSSWWVHPVCYAWDLNGRLGLRVALADMAGLTQYADKTKLGKVQSMVEPPAWNWITSQPRPSALSDFPSDKFLIAVHKAKTGTALGGSCLRPLAWWWVASNFCGDWLLNYAQLFGIPFRKATLSASAWGNQLEKAEIRQMLQSCGSAGYIMLPNGSDVEFMKGGEAAGQSPQAFLFHFADSQKRKVILHQTMTGGQHDSMGKGGGKAFGEVEQDTKNECITAGAMFAEEVINLQMVPMVLKLNYGEDGDLEAPTVKLIDEQFGSLNDAQTDQIVSQLVDVPESHIRRKYRVPKPQAGEKIAGKDTGTGNIKPPAQKAFGEPEPDKGNEPNDSNEPKEKVNEPNKARYAIEAGDFPGHDFHGNQWTHGALAEVTKPLSKRITLGSEVVWRGEDGNVHHGQLGFADNNGNVKVDRVSIISYPHPKIQNLTIRELRPTGERVLVPKEHLRQPYKGFVQREHIDSRRIAVNSPIEAATAGPSPVTISDAAKALHGTVEPLLERLKAIEAVSDLATRRKLLKKFLKDHAQIVSAMVHDDSLSKAVTPALVKKFLEGANK